MAINLAANLVWNLLVWKEKGVTRSVKYNGPIKWGPKMFSSRSLKTIVSKRYIWLCILLSCRILTGVASGACGYAASVAAHLLILLAQWLRRPSTACWQTRTEWLIDFCLDWPLYLCTGFNWFREGSFYELSSSIYLRLYSIVGTVSNTDIITVKVTEVCNTRFCFGIKVVRPYFWNYNVLSIFVRYCTNV